MDGTTRPSARARIDSLHAIRGLAFLGIFLYHAVKTFPGGGVFYDLISTGPGPCGVSVFFILSGFLMTYSYWDREPERNLKACAAFSIKKIRRLYPLHLIMLAFGVLRLKMRHHSTSEILIRLLKTVPLLQTWFPTGYQAINTVAWYLSVCLFLYFIFPFLLPGIKRGSKAASLLKALVIYALQVSAGYIAAHYTGLDLKWVTYCHPLYRTCDFMIGACLASFFEHDRQEADRSSDAALWTCLETVAVLLTLASCIVFTKVRGSDLLWFARTCLFVPACALLVFAFSYDSGHISGLLKNRVVFWLADISPQAYLIHRLVIFFFRDITNDILHIEEISTLLVIAVPAVITVAMTYLYNACAKKCSKRL